MEPLARAVLDIGLALRAVNSRLVVMPPLAQHFAGDPEGLYSNSTLKNRNQRSALLKQQQQQQIGLEDGLVVNGYDLRACAAHQLQPKDKAGASRTGQLPSYQHPDGLHFLSAMERLDPDWRKHVGWIDVTAYSVPWYDLHPESGSSGWVVDCTHYGYTPLMYEAVWLEMSRCIGEQKELLRLTVE